MVRISGRIGERDGTYLYSFRVGTAKLHTDGSISLSSHLALPDVADANKLLEEVRLEYHAKQLKERAERAKA